MLDCTTTPLALKLNFLCDPTLEIFDSTVHGHMIGSLMYLKNMRPNICFAMNTLIQFLMDPRHVHLITAKHILRYLKGIVEYGIKYEKNQNINLDGYVDSDWEGDTTERNITLGCCFSLGSGMIS